MPLTKPRASSTAGSHPKPGKPTSGSRSGSKGKAANTAAAAAAPANGEGRSVRRSTGSAQAAPGSRTGSRTGSGSGARPRGSRTQTRPRPRQLSQAGARASTRPSADGAGAGWHPVTPKSFASARAAGDPTPSSSSSSWSAPSMVLPEPVAGIYAGPVPRPGPPAAYVAFADESGGGATAVPLAGARGGADGDLPASTNAQTAAADSSQQQRDSRSRDANDSPMRASDTTLPCPAAVTVPASTGGPSSARPGEKGVVLLGDLSGGPMTVAGASVHTILDGMASRASWHAKRASSVRTRSSMLRSTAAIREELHAIQRACGFGLDEELEVTLRAAEWGVDLYGPWMAASGTAPPARGSTIGSTAARRHRRVRSLDGLSAATLLRVMEFCDMPSLATLSRTSARMYIIAQHEDLWRALAADRGVAGGGDGGDAAARPLPLGSTTTPKGALRAAVTRERVHGEAEVAHWEQELSQLEKRMAVRTEANYRENINVDRTLTTHNPAAILSGTFSKRIVRRTSSSSGGYSSVDDTPSAEAYRAMLRQLKDMEAARRTIEAGIAANAQSLANQQATIQELIARTEAIVGQGLQMGGSAGGGQGGRADDTSATLPAIAGAATTASTSQGGPLNAREAGQPLMSRTEITCFERRMVRLVLNGGYNSNSAVGAARDDAIPVVLRRGIVDFGTLELLLLHLGRDTSADGPGRRAVEARWKAFCSFFPPNDDYYLVRQYLEECDGANRQGSSPPCESGLTVSDASRAAALEDGGGIAGAVRVPPRRLQTALLRLTGVVRKVAAMKDSEVLQVIM